MSDRVPNAYPNFPNNFSQGLSSQQAQHRPPQQLSSLGTQSTLTGIRRPEDRAVWQQSQQQRQQQQLQQQQQHSGGESMHVTTPQQQQFLQFLQNQVAQGHMTVEQARERVAMFQTSAAHAFQEQNAPQQIPSGFTAGGMAGSSAQQQMAALSQRSQASPSNPMIQRVMQAQQDSLHARQLNMLVAQGQQQQNGFASRVGQNLHPPGMGLPQGQGSLQQNFIQPSPSVLPANIQSSVAPSASQPTPPGGTQMHSLPKNFIDMPVPQLSIVYGQLMRTVEEGEKNLNCRWS
ncbi:hypothetical protein H4582DRAFT_1578721 [Lactarius indigo]|nr:hypothetical protein H4582DRAFT_1578721 [Lactarius indigo]